MAQVKHTVVKGDTLSGIAVHFGTSVSELVRLNNIKDPDYIVVGQELVITGDAVTTTPNTTDKATIDLMGVQSNTDRTIYVTWSWDRDSDTEHYQIKWYYDTGDDVWFVGSDTTTKEKQATYNAPTNANRVKFTVKPVAKTGSTNKSGTAKFTAKWSTAKIYSFKDNVPTVPPVPTVTVDKYELTAKLENLNVGTGKEIYFQLMMDNTKVVKTGKAVITGDSATWRCTLSPGHEYKVRCRAEKTQKTGNYYSNYSNWSANYRTIPSAPTGITSLKATSETSVYLEWGAVNTATSYAIEYATKVTYFDGSSETTIIDNIEFTHYEKTGLETGEEYFFRVRAVNDQGYSAWSGIKSVTIGKKPTSPTTWSSTTTAIVGEELNLYWVHNSVDGSSWTYSELELTIGNEVSIIRPKNTASEDEKDKTSVYTIDTSQFTEGTQIRWRVRTAGITTVYGDWSVERVIDIYAPPTLNLEVNDSDGETLETLTTFPFYISALAGPSTQLPIGYHVTITSTESYETVDAVGNTKVVNEGEQIYSKYFDIKGELTLMMSANHVDLENNIRYKIKVVVSMNSGLTGENETEFSVAWNDISVDPNAEIGINYDDISAYIRPYCVDAKGAKVEDVILSVYRREYDGRFTEIATGISNDTNTFVTDPHPALDYARYRIVAIANSTGAVSYCDLAGYPVGEKSVVIQWDEAWSSFDTTNSDALAEAPWAGSMLKLPYNIDISDSYKQDVALIEYIGREHPVSYYGTHLGETATWNVVIDKEDVETLYSLRRLAKWMGDVYVREPSGSGYHANVSVSFSQKHLDLTIPVTLTITRVEGGA